MEAESLVQLVGSGNTATVEEEWMKVVEGAELTLPELAGYNVVLAELCRLGNESLAAELAWMALESLSSRHSAQDLLTVAGPFLLRVGNSDDLRAQVADLYRAAYGDRKGLEVLLDESGIAGGRPVRRALRTLDVCLALREGDYLVARDEEGAARIDSIDCSTWEFTVTVGQESQTLDPVQLADTYEPALPTDFRVLWRFAPEELSKKLQGDPGSSVIDLCRRHGNKLDSDVLEALLVPDLLSKAEWKQWWPRARTALKRSPHVTLKGRSPYYIEYHDQPITLEQDFLGEFQRRRDLTRQTELLEQYLRECKSRPEGPSNDALRQCYEVLCERARRLAHAGAATAGLCWVIAFRVGDLAGVEGAGHEAAAFLRDAPDLGAVFQHIESEVYIDLACRCLAEARPDDWADRLWDLLPAFPLAACDQAVSRLAEAGRTPADFDALVQRVLDSPIPHFEALLWLWDGPADADLVAGVTPMAVLTRILRTLEDVRLADDVPRDRLRTMRTRARAVLSARKYERFAACVDALEPGVARALRRQIARSESFGHTVRDNLIRVIDRRVPPLETEAEIEPWEREDVLYVTKIGLARKQEEIEHHVNVKMAENSRAIGRAAERGDLSENSEYKFALEERDLLRARLAQMNAELAQARIIDPEDVPTTQIGVGTTAEFRRVSDGDRYEMSFLGPWETDTAKGRFNYKAPLPQRLMGKRVGDVVEFDHSGVVGEYEIVALRNALTG